jgi:hypothetical protein
MSKAAAKNLVGPVIRKIRRLRGMTQATLAARCNRVGLDVGENISAKIEAQIRCVTDREIVHLAKVPGIKVQDFF